MTANECYEFGRYAYETMKFRLSAEWFREAMKLLPDGIVTMKAKILDYLHFCEYKCGSWLRSNLK